MQSTDTLPSIAAVITHSVQDYDAWKRAFDAHAPTRRAAGIVDTHVNRHDGDPNQISLYLAATDESRLRGFLDSTDLMAKMREAGVKGPPHIAMITPVEDRTVKDRPLAGVIVRHEVRDYATWKPAFDRHEDTRAAAGILGHAVNRSVASPNLVVVYLQAESLDSLRNFASSPELEQVMQAAGVVSAPELTFVQGVEWSS